MHTEFERFAHKPVGGAVGILSYAVLLLIWPGIDLVGATVLAILIGSVFWFLLSYLVTCYNGLCIEFRYSKSRPGFSVVTFWRGLKKLGEMELDVGLDKSGTPELMKARL